MPLIVEDGSGLANAESYLSAADADTYHTARGNAGWTGSQAVKEEALRRATDYMQQAYRSRWKSFRTTATQALDWPRAWMQYPDSPTGYGAFASYIPNNVVPVEVKNACAELALQALAGDLNPALDRVTVREQVGPIAVDYDKNAPQYKRYRNVDQLLAPLLDASGISMKLVRA